MSDLTFEQAQRQIRQRGRRRLLFRAHGVLFALGLIVFFFWLRAQPIGYPHFLLPPTLWAFLFIAHWFYHGTTSMQDEAVEHLWENVYGARPGDTVMKREPESDFTEMPSYEHIRRMVETELQREKVKRRRLLFRINLAAYLGVMLMSWIVIPVIYGPFLTASSTLTIFALSLGGLAQVLLHYKAVQLDTADGERALRERLLGRALERMAGADGRMPEKAKRTLRLTEDGELDTTAAAEADSDAESRYHRT